MPRLPVPKPLSFLVADKQKDLTELAQALGKLVPTQNGWGCHMRSTLVGQDTLALVGQGAFISGGCTL